MSGSRRMPIFCKVQPSSIVVGTILHFALLIAGILMVSVSKTRSEVGSVVVGFLLPFVLSGWLLGSTQGIQHPVVTALVSATLVAVLAAFHFLWQAVNLTYIPIGLIPSILLSVLASAIAASATKRSVGQPPSHLQ